MTMERYSDGDLAVNSVAADDISYSLVNYSDISYDQTNNVTDWYFPVIDLCEDGRWLLFEDKLELNDSCISEICYIFKKKLSCEFQTEIFLQHPLVIKKLIKWLNENKETELILECLNYFVEKLVKRHFEFTSGLCENVEIVDNSSSSNSQITTGTNSETTTNNGISRWGIAKFCASLMPTLMKHIVYNCSEAFSLFISSIHLLSSIAGSCNITFYLELIISNCMIKHTLPNEPSSSLMFLIIAKKLLPYSISNEQFKEVILNILKQPYWIHLYPDLYHQLYIKIINEELLEKKIIKMVENVYTLLFSCNLDIKQYGHLLNTSMPIIWFHQKFNIIDKFIGDVCKYANLTDPYRNEYSNILLNLLSYKSLDVVIHTYSALNKTVKSILNNFHSQSNKISRLLEHLLCTKVLNEIVCSGCANSNEQICQLASEVIELLLNCKNTVKIDQWKKFLSNLVPVLPVLNCYANQTSTFGQIIFNLFHPDQAEELNISNLMLLHSIIIMLLSKDKKCRIEANNRLTWFLQTMLNKSIDLPNDIFVIEFDDLSEKLEEPIGEYSTNDLDDMIDLIENNSSHQIIKCALYKVSVMLEYNHLQQHFIHNRGINIILNLLKSTKLFVNERGLLIALLKLILCFTKKKKFTSNENDLLANNFDIQLQLISVLSDFYDIPLVKQYILQILFFCIFNQYLTKFNKMPSLVVCKIYIPIQIDKYWNSNNNYTDVSLFSKIKESKSCMDVLILTWNLKQFDNTELFLENGLDTSTQSSLFHEVFYNFRKACIKWSVKKYLIDLIAANSHPVALFILGDLKRYLELSVHIKKFDVDEELLENALRKFLVLPPIMLSDLQTLIVVMKLLHFVLQKRVLISKFHWVPDLLMKSKFMHHNMADNFNNDDISNQLCNQFFVELYEVYWLCLKNYSHFCTLDLTKLLFNQLPSMKNEFVLLQVNLKCLTLLTENQKNIDIDLVKLFLSQLIPLKTILMNSYNEKNVQRSYLIILNHILHHTILVPNIYEVWCLYDWETWTWSMIHSTDPLVRALIFQFSAGLAVIDISVSHNLINLALNYFCEIHCLENCIVAEQATIFCSNVFCNPKFKDACHKYINKLDFNTFIYFINLCSYDDFNKFEKSKFSTSPKLVANICCMLFNMITLTGIDLQKFDQNSQFLHSLIICLKKKLTPVCIEEPNIMEMCGRICSILTLFIPYSNYSFENVLTSLNIIYERIDIKLDHCTIMVWRSLFKLTTTIIQYTNNQTFIVTNYLISALLKSITSINNDLSIDALNVVAALCSLFSKQSALCVCKVLIETLISDWHIKKKRTMLLIALSNVLLEHPFTYETAKKENLLYFITSKLKMMLLQITKQSSQKSKTLLNHYLEIVGFFCNIFHGCVQAREDASSELPDVIHKLWSIVISNPKSDILINTMQMLVSLTSNCPSACSAMTMTSSTLGVDPKTKITSYSLFHDIISLFSYFTLHTEILSIMLLLISNCCQSQECRAIITKSKLLSHIISVLNLKDKKRSNKIEQECLNFLLIFTSYDEGQIHLLKVNYVLDILVDLLKSNFKNDSLAILRNLCFNVQNRVTFLSSDVFLNGIKSMLEEGNLSNQNYKDISLSMWSIACNNQKACLELRHWGIDKYFEKCDLSLCNDETRMIMNCTYKILRSK